MSTVRRGILEDHEADSMLEWPHSGFHVHDGVLAPEEDTAFALRLARYCARNPVALERLEYERAANRVTYRSDKLDGPTAGAETLDPLEFLARLTVHIPNKRQVMTRYFGWYANRPRGTRRKRAAAESPSAVPVAQREVVPLTEARRRWAEPLRCPVCAAEMRIVAFITERSVIDRILAHLRQRRETPPSRAPPRRRSRSAGTPAHA